MNYLSIYKKLSFAQFSLWCRIFVGIIIIWALVRESRILFISALSLRFFWCIMRMFPLFWWITILWHTYFIYFGSSFFHYLLKFIVHLFKLVIGYYLMCVMGFFAWITKQTFQYTVFTQTNKINLFSLV